MFLRGWALLMRGGPVMLPLLACALLSLTFTLERAWALSRAHPHRPNRYLPVLDTIITVAPLLGLLGTVTGMIRAFHVLDRAGPLQQPATVPIAGGVAEALIATAVGLGIAIVTLAAYNALSARADTLRAALPAAPSAPRRPAPFRKARIEIIPMIDTIFFLLVFFMLTSLQTVPMSARKVRLPQSATARLHPGHNLVVTLTRDGQYYLNYRRVSELDIRPQVAAQVNRDPQTTVVLNCDRGQPAARILRLLDLTKQANAARVVLATAPPDPPEAPHGTP